MAGTEAPPPPAIGNALPAGTRVGEFELRQVIGVGGFGIVYLAFDLNLLREVAIKEYMPQALASRTATLHVSLTSPSNAETFALGLKSFVNEARLLARFDHPSLIKVHRFIEERGTAYMVMPLYRGHTLREVRLSMAKGPTEVWLRRLLDQVLGALEVLHREEVFHRDIAPDNILVGEDGTPMLLDFGAARHVISDRTQSVTAILKPSYAPIEQYGETAQLRQGAWTDIYALGATLHFAITKSPPAPSTARMVSDDNPPLAEAGVAGIRREFLAVIDWMLAPRPADRPQSVDQLRQVLKGLQTIPERLPVAAPIWEQTRPKTDNTNADGAFDKTAVVPRGSGFEKTTFVPRAAAAQASEGQLPPAASDAAAAAAAPALTGRQGGRFKVARPGKAARAALPISQAAGTASPAAPASAPAPTARRLPWVGIGLGAALLMVGAFWALLRNATGHEPRALAASSALVTGAASGSVAQPAAPLALPSTAVATTQVINDGPSVAKPSGGAASTALSAALSASAARPAASRAAAAERKLSAPSAAQPAAASGDARNASPWLANPAAPSASAAKSAPRPAAAAMQAPDTQASPREICGGRILLAMHQCLLRECVKPQYQAHAECERVRLIEERARNAQQ